MRIKPVHVPEDDCYRVYLIGKGLRQQVGSDFTYTEEKQEPTHQKNQSKKKRSRNKKSAAAKQPEKQDA